jgi:hypothetical protein
MTIPDLTRVSHLDLHAAEEKVLCGAAYGKYGIFGTGAAASAKTLNPFYFRCPLRHTYTHTHTRAHTHTCTHTHTHTHTHTPRFTSSAATPTCLALLVCECVCV